MYDIVYISGESSCECDLHNCKLIGMGEVMSPSALDENMDDGGLLSKETEKELPDTRLKHM